MNTYKINHKMILGLTMLCLTIVFYSLLLRFSISKRYRYLKLQKKFIKQPEDKLNKAGIHIHRKKKAKHTKLPVYVVEDNHEAFSYWVKAQQKAIIEKTGNTLIHISNKGDSLPFFMDHFKWPAHNLLRNNKGKSSKRQSNLNSGLFDRFVWVWPKWDTKPHSNKYTLTYFGRTNKKYAKKAVRNCSCSRHYKSKRKICHLEFQELQSSSRKKQIHDNMCDVSKRIYLEKIKEDFTLESLQNTMLIRKDENVVLNIDEEYIGHEISFAPLFAAGLTFSNVSLINKEVQKIICPKVMKDEQKADIVLSKVIFEISKLRRRFCMKKKAEMCLKFPYSKNFSSALHTFTNSLTSLSPALGCKKKIGTKYVENFVLKLASFKEKQLLAIREIGFCFAPLSKSLNLEYHFQLCLGGSVLNSSSGHLRSLQQQEVVSRTKFFQKFMSLSKFQPRIITLARSIRSGFTSRKYFHKIEREILASLRAFHSKLQIHYDSGLLGGKFGWPKRHSQNTTV